MGTGSNRRYVEARLRNGRLGRRQGSSSVGRRKDKIFFALMENAPLGVYVVDSHFRLRAINKGAEAVFRDIAPLLGRDFAEIIRIIWPEPFASEAIGRFRHTLATGETYIAPVLTETRQNVDRVESYDWQIRRMRLPDGSFGVVCYFHDLTLVRQAEAVVASSAQRDAFLLELNDRLRLLSEPNEILSAAAEVLARRLDLTSAGYGEVEADGDTILVGGEFTDRGLPESERRYRISDFGEGFGSRLRAGEDVFSEDIPADRLGREPAGGSTITRALPMRAAAATPLIKGGRLVAFLYATHDEPRPWSEWERRLLHDVAERTWAAVERARAQDELRKRTAQFEILVRQAPIGVYLVDDHFRIRQVNPAARRMFGDIPDLIGRDFDEVSHLLWARDDADALVRLFRYTLSTGESYATLERAEHRRDRELVEHYEWRIDRIPLSDDRCGVVCYFRDVSAYVHAREAIAASEEVLRRAAAADAFRVALADALRPLTEPVEIQAVAVRVLGERLMASRALYCEVEKEDGGGGWIVRHDYHAPDVATHVGRDRARDLGAASFDELRAGRTLAVADVAVEPMLTPAERESHSAHGVQAYVGVPFIKGGRFVAVLEVHQATPRQWTHDEIALIEETAERTWSSVERAKVEAALRESDERQAFMLKLSDALRPLADPVEIQGEAARLLGERLDADWAYYAEYDEAVTVATIHRDYVRHGAPSLVGQHSLDEYRGWARELRAGRTVPIEDMATSPLISERGRTLYESMGIKSGLNVPIVKGGVFIASVAVIDRKRRTWTPLEFAIIEGTAERTWAAVERAHAEATLRQTEMRYRELFDTIDEGVCILEQLPAWPDGRHDYRYLAANPAMLAMFEVSDLTGHTARTSFPAENEEWYDTIERVITTGDAVRVVRQMAHHEMVLDAFLSRIEGGARRRVMVVVRDVTARLRAEDALRQSEERKAFLLTLSDALRPLIDPVEIQTVAVRVLGERLGARRALYGDIESKEDSDYYVVGPQYCAPGVPSVIGSFRVDDFGAKLFDDCRAGRTVVVADVASEAKLTDRERAAYPAAGVRAYVVVPLIKGGRLVAFITVSQFAPRAWTAADVSLVEETAERTWAAVERTRAEASLRESEARLRLALDASRMGTFLWHVQEDRGEPDARMLALFGLPKTGTLNQSAALETLIHPDDRAHYAEAVRGATDPEGSGVLRDEFRVLHPDGSVHWLAIQAQVSFEGSPRRAVRLVGICADISERKFTEEALREREERLKESDRRKDEFLAMLAHELRNPLAPIRTGLELIRLAGNTPDAVERVRAMMERQVGHMVRLIDDLLDVSRITSGKIRLQRQPAPLATLVNTAVEANRVAIHARRLSLNVDLPHEPVILDVDPTRFVQVVSNLLHNAVKFTDPGGQIRIDAELKPPAEGADGELSVTVTDSGIGITREMLPRVFDLFIQGEATAQSSQGGLGIGLALARRLIEMHGGSIDASSGGPGHGSTFTIHLPFSTSVVEPTPVEPAAPASKIKRRVVVIDDNEDSANVMAMFVSALGCEFRVAYDGESGLVQVLEFRPDAVLLDIGMPGIDGYETCRRIRKALGSTVVVVAMTGWGQEQDKETTRRAGFDAHLTKPVDPAVLERVLAEARPAG